MGAALGHSCAHRATAARIAGASHRSGQPVVQLRQRAPTLFLSEHPSDGPACGPPVPAVVAANQLVQRLNIKTQDEAAPDLFSAEQEGEAAEAPGAE